MAFMKSSSDVTIDSATAVLSAKCLISGKDSKTSTFKLNDLLSNIDGQFAIGLGQGGFVSSASEIKLSIVDYSTRTCILSAKLKDKKGTNVDAKLNLNDFIANDNGNLVVFKEAVFLSSEKIRLEGSVLKASCKNKAGQMVDSELDLNPLIGNINGQFKWGKSNFQASASNIKLENTIYLTANLKDQFGKETFATLSLVSYVANLDGKLAGLQSVDVQLTYATMKPLLQELTTKFPRAVFETSVSQDNKIQYLYFNANAGVDDNLLFTQLSAETSGSIFHIAQETGRPIENVSVDVLQVKAGVQLGSYVGVEAGVYLLNASASIFDAKLGFGVSTGVGIENDSFNFKIAGAGFTVGRRIGVSVFDNEFAIDFGRCLVM